MSNKDAVPAAKKNSKKYAYIDGHRFPIKVDGMTLVGAYYVPDADVEAYVKLRAKFASKAEEIYRKHCPDVRLDFAGSQDGEALVGRDAAGEIMMLIHLDPDGIQAMNSADQEGKLEEYLLEWTSAGADPDYDPEAEEQL